MSVLWQVSILQAVFLVPALPNDAVFAMESDLRSSKRSRHLPTHLRDYLLTERAAGVTRGSSSPVESGRTRDSLSLREFEGDVGDIFKIPGYEDNDAELNKSWNARSYS